MATAIESITISNSYQVNITQTANQTISVQEVLNPNKTGKESSFSIDTASYDPPYIKVTLTAATGYNKGTLRGCYESEILCKGYFSSNTRCLQRNGGIY